jgi:flagellar basal body-associated protein FliL
MKKIWIVLITFMVSAGLIGGGVWYYQSVKAKNNTNDLNSQIALLNTQKTDLQNQLNATPTTNPATVVTNFYNWFFNPTGSYPDSTNALVSAPGGSQTFESWYNTAKKAQPAVGGYNPLNCAQSSPSSFTVKTLSQMAATAQVEVIQSFSPALNFTVNLVASNNSWLLQSVTCPK